MEMTVKEYAEKYGLKDTEVREMCKNKIVNAEKIKGTWKIYVDVLEEDVGENAEEIAEESVEAAEEVVEETEDVKEEETEEMGSVKESATDETDYYTVEEDEKFYDEPDEEDPEQESENDTITIGELVDMYAADVMSGAINDTVDAVIKNIPMDNDDLIDFDKNLGFDIKVMMKLIDIGVESGAVRSYRRCDAIDDMIELLSKRPIRYARYSKNMDKLFKKYKLYKISDNIRSWVDACSISNYTTSNWLMQHNVAL